MTIAEPQKLKIIDNASVGEIYANKLVAAAFDGGAVVITLGATRFVPEQSVTTSKESSPPPVHVTARLAISPAGAVELANALNAMLKTLSQMQQRSAEAKPAQAN
jgi:hypothetical protein